jgi:hypothetical protein
MANQPNIPGQPNYNYERPPDYTPPSAGQTQALNSYANNIGYAPGYEPAVDRTYNLLDQPGAYDQMGIDPKMMTGILAKYMQGGYGVGDKFSAAAKSQRDMESAKDYASLNATTAGAGNIGSTVAGINRMDLTDRYLNRANQENAQAAQLQEAVNSGRFGQVMNAAQGYTGQMQNEWTGRTMASQNLADLALKKYQQDMMNRGQNYSMQKDYSQQPNEYGFRAWEDSMAVPKKEKDSFMDQALGIFSTVAPFIL